MKVVYLDLSRKRVIKRGRFVNNLFHSGEDIYTPFTIDELTKHFDKNIPIHVEEDDVELLSKLNHINLDVENLTAKNISDFHTPQKDLSQNLITETHSFVLRKNDINCYIIKEMNLASHMFFQDTGKLVYRVKA